MALQLLLFNIVKGMNQDSSIHTATPDTAFRLFNIKTLTLDNSTNSALTNEKGNTLLELLDENTGEILNIYGDIIGIIHCTTEMVVLFVYTDTGYNSIYRISYKKNTDQLTGKLLAQGLFGIPRKANISGIFLYEHSELQKIYWVDGTNLLRYLNISDSNKYFSNNSYIKDVDKLNSNPSFKIDHHITVERVVGGGIFTAGVVQYAFTYFNKYGAETNIVDITPLHYISEATRGIANDETVGCSFKVTIENPDTSFDYIRVYSIQRTSLNGPAIVKIVGDISLNSNNK